MRTFCRLAAVIGLFSLATAAVQAAGVYTIQRIVRLGDKVGTPPITTSVGLWVGALNDRGQIAFISGSSGGGPALFQYDNGQFTPLVVAGQYGPLGKWSSLLELWSPVSMNQAGNVVFSVWDHQLGTPIGNFVWDAKAHQITAVAPKGTPIGGNLTLVESGGPSPVTNDQNEIALVADVKNSAGEAQTGVFFLGRDGRLQPVVLPDGSLPDATFCRSASHPSSTTTAP